MKRTLLCGIMAGMASTAIFAQGLTANLGESPVTAFTNLPVAFVLTDSQTDGVEKSTPITAISSVGTIGLAPLLNPQAPEPSSIILGGMGAAVLLIFVRRKK